MSTTIRWLLGGALAASALPCLASDEEEALDADFLDYLDTFEGEREDWTWFAEEDSQRATPAPPSTTDDPKDAQR